jgi:hypothetical protein
MMYALGNGKEGPMTLEQRIALIKRRIAELRPFLPGSISEQYNVCGKAGCACKDPRKPRKHGPYYQLSFSVRGKSSSMFLRKADVPEARRRIARYQQFKALSFELVDAYVALARSEGLQRSRTDERGAAVG